MILVHSDIMYGRTWHGEEWGREMICEIHCHENESKTIQNDRMAMWTSEDMNNSTALNDIYILDESIWM